MLKCSKCVLLARLKSKRGSSASPFVCTSRMNFSSTGRSSAFSESKSSVPPQASASRSQAFLKKSSSEIIFTVLPLSENSEISFFEAVVLPEQVGPESVIKSISGISHISFIMRSSLCSKSASHSSTYAFFSASLSKVVFAVIKILLSTVLKVTGYAVRRFSVKISCLRTLLRALLFRLSLCRKIRRSGTRTDTSA